MPFGLMNQPATFQALMNELFKLLLQKYVLVFFDNILIYSRTIEEHVQHLVTVLGILKNQQLYVNILKCCIAQRRLEYFGHIISKEGVAANQAKIEAMLRWPTLRTLRKLRGLLGLTEYYRKVVAGYGKPLTKQLKKKIWVKRHFKG